MQCRYRRPCWHKFVIAASFIVSCSVAVLGAENAPQRPTVDTSERKIIELFDGKTLGNWKVVEQFEFRNHGPVEVRDGAIILGAGRPGTCIRYDGRLPSINYEILLDAQRVDGEDFFCGLTFMVGDEPLSLILGGWGGKTCGLSCIDGEPAAENETCEFRDFENKRWYAVRIRVTKPKIQVWLDNEKLIDFEREDKRLSIWFEKECVTPLAIATWRTTGAVKNLRIVPIESEPKQSPANTPSTTADYDSSGVTDQ